jgi:pectate lyase
MTTGLARQSLHLTASSSSSKSRRYHRYPRQRGGGGRREEVVVVNTTTNSNKKISPTTKTTHVVALIIGSLGTSLLASQSSVLFSAFAEEASATASGSEISPFAGVVDIAALGLLGVFAYLGNKKSSENVQSERQKTITNMPSRRNRTPPPKPK